MLGQSTAHDHRDLLLIVDDQNAFLTFHQSPECSDCESTTAEVSALAELVSTSSSPTGTVNVILVPLPPSPFWIIIRPPCASTMPLAIDRPMPIPSGRPDPMGTPLTCTNFSKTRCRKCSGIPGPSSPTETLTISPGARLALIVMHVPAGANLVALSIKV